MQKAVIFRDYQEQVADDHNALQSYARTSFDTLARDGVTASRKFAGFAVTKTGQVEVGVAPGRIYGPNDDATGTAVFARATSLTQSMATYTAAAAKRIVSVSAYGNENETDETQRDYLVDVDTGRTEPRTVDMTRSRDAQIVFTSGSESADPQPPALPTGHVEIARILLDTTQVVSVTMMTDNLVTSTDALNLRAKDLETFKDQIGPRVSGLAGDLASLQNQIRGLAAGRDISRLMEDMARVKEALSFPDDATDYGADRFLTPDESDVDDAAGQGYDAKIEEGIRFPDANADEFEIALFSANDPNAAYAGGVLLPKYTEELKLSTGDFHSDIGIQQFGYQTFENKIGYMSNSRIRYGGSYSVCTNGNYFSTAGEPPPAAALYDFETWELVQTYLEYVDPNSPAHQQSRTDMLWIDSWKEPYVYAQTVDHTITGALVAQSFLVSNDMWATSLGFYLTAKAANENVHLTLCEIVNGVPDVTRSVSYINVPHTSLLIGWNKIAIQPTFLSKGKRYAVVVVSNANHKFGLSDGQSYLDGTFFTSTDGAYFLGDLTKDLMIQVYGAKFNAPQVVIEFSPINLDGGFRDIDILAQQWTPASTGLFFELRPNGTGAWIALTKENLAALSGAPVLAQFRARFVGTADMMPALTLTGSRVHVSRPKTAFKHVSTEVTFATSVTHVVVKLTMERFDDTPHDLTCILRHGTTNETPDATVTKALPDLPYVTGRYERTFTFDLGAGITAATIIVNGATTSAANVFHVAERVHYATA